MKHVETFKRSFEFEITTYEDDLGNFILRLRPIELIGDPDSHGRQEIGPAGGGAFSIPKKVFPDEQTRDLWVHKVVESFKNLLTGTMGNEAFWLFNDMGNLFLERMNLDPVGKRELIDIHLNGTEARIREYVGAKGLRSKWTRAALERAVRHALSTLKKEGRTLDDVAGALNKTYPDKAPNSGEALGAMLKRFRLDWKKLKTDS